MSRITTNCINTNFSALWFGFSICRTKQSELSSETTSGIPELQATPDATVSDIVFNLIFDFLHSFCFLMNIQWLRLMRLLKLHII